MKDLPHSPAAAPVTQDRASEFKDHFGTVSRHYADHRPTYPAALFDWLAAQCSRRTLAWDCATGTGQAAVGLAQHFDQVVATDASAGQIDVAEAHPRIEYRVAPAEHSGLTAACVDLVTVAQALHWFDVDAFWQEVRRVVRPEGVVAVWTYGGLEAGAVLDERLRHFYREVVGPFWPPQRRHVETGYRELSFPFRSIETPLFEVRLQWTLPQLLGYLRSWSATAGYRQAKGKDPVEAWTPQFRRAWGGADAVREMRWPLLLRVGRVA